MRIYAGWKIQSTDPFTEDLNGALIHGSKKLRSTHHYIVEKENGETISIKRSAMINMVERGEIWFCTT
jgi:hypothetical protein